MSEAYIFDAIRTPRGKGDASGKLYEVKPIDLLTNLLKTLEQRHSLDTTEIEDVVIGCAVPMLEQGGNIAFAAAANAGWNTMTSGIQLNRFGGSGLESIALAASKIQSGWQQLVVAGGLESTSRVPRDSDQGPMSFDPVVSVRISHVPYGISADLLATKAKFTRKQLDDYALRSHQNALKAQENQYFNRSIVPVTDAVGLSILEHDEWINPDLTLEILSNLSPQYAELGRLGFDELALRHIYEVERIEHLHTSVNRAKAADGAAVVLLGNEAKGKLLGLQPRAKVKAVITATASPSDVLTAPIIATQKILQLTKLQVQDIDLWEMNEIFAAVALQYQQTFELPDDKFNVNGGAIAMGHPLGASGTILVNILLDELERQDLTLGLVVLNAGANMAVAAIIERVK